MAYLFVAAVTFLVYVPSLANGFVDWDDNLNIIDNTKYRGLSFENVLWMFTAFRLGHYQPLSWLTLGVDFVVWGMNPFGYHLTSAILHALCAAALAWVTSWIFARGRTALDAREPDRDALAFGAIVALAWSLHPLRVEAVSWVTERREVLCGLLTLLSVGSYLRGRSRWQAWAFAILAMFAKVTAATIPALLVLVDLHRDGLSAPRALLRSFGRAIVRHLPLVAVACAFVVTAILAQREAEAFVSWADLPLGRRLVLTLHSITFCLVKSIWPSGLAVLHQGKIGSTWQLRDWIWWQAGVALLLLLAALVIAWRTRRRGLGALCLLVAFVVTVLPTGGLGQSGPQTSADRYTYQSGWVLTLAVGLLLASWTDWPARVMRTWHVALPVAALLGLLVFLTIRQEATWRDTTSLWLRQLEIHPDSPTGNHQLGRHYVAETPPRFDLAEPRFRAAFAWAPEYIEPQHALGLLLRNTGRMKESVEVFKNIVRQWPRHRESWFQLAMALWETGDRDNAVNGFDNYVRLDRSDPAAWRLFAKAQAANGKPRDAVATLEKAIAAAPSPLLTGDLAWLLATHPDPAIRDGRRALELAEKDLAAGPPDFRVVLAFAAACAEAGQFERAKREVEAAIPRLPKEAEPALRRLLEDLAQSRPVRTEPRFP
jgi:Flp pilus assembly protein TadD